MRTFLVVMGDELRNGCPQGLFPKQQEAVQTRFLDAPYESLGMSVQIRGACGQFHGLNIDVREQAQKLGCK